MKVNILINYPWWFLLICVFIGFMVSAVLYYKSKSDELSLLQKKILAGVRFVIITVLCFLLLSPLLEMQLTRAEEPIVLFFQDNSLSLITGSDSLFMQEEYPIVLQDLLEGISQDYSLTSYVFGEEVRRFENLDYQDKITDISEIFSALNTFYSSRNVGAVIIASDGIFNRGSNPIYRAASQRLPVYTMALGDTIPQRDLIINNIKHNTITYLNNLFPLEVTVEANQAMGQSSNLKVIHDNQTVFQKSIAFTSDHHFETILIELEAEETGMKHYKVEIEPIADEISITNNSQEFFIEVIDSRQKVLVLAHSPHPDIGALKLALEDNENYEVDVFLLDNFTDNLLDYNLVIWHQIPSTRHANHPLLAEAKNAAMPQVFILGSQSNIQAFNRLQTGLQLNLRSSGSNDSRAEPNPGFMLFSISESTRSLLPSLPPLHTHFASYSMAPATQSFLHQRIGNVTTEYPLIAFSEVGEQKTAVITGEGIWRWRLANYARQSNHNAFNELVSRMIQFISVVEDKSFFRVNTTHFLFENEPAIFNAELYNRSYELVNDPEVKLEIINDQGLVFDYTFARTTNAYTINAGSFPVGEYSYTASVDFGQDSYREEGVFSVSPLNIEGTSTIANHQLLYQLASSSGGNLYYPEQWEELLNHLRSREDIGPVLYSQKEFEELINLQWIFFLILALLALEWFTRKYNGGY